MVNEPCTLFELSITRCKYPVTDDQTSPILFCGVEKPASVHPYCEACTAIAYLPLPKKRKETLNVGTPVL